LFREGAIGKHFAPKGSYESDGRKTQGMYGTGFSPGGSNMKSLKYGLIAGLFLVFAGYASSAHAQAAVQVGPVGFAYGPGPAYVGLPPNCVYGYYGYYPYACAPYGYYGPAYFYNGVFIGAGPWYGWGWRGRGWWGDHDGWRDRDGWRGFRGEGGWRDRDGFHEFRGGGAWRGGEGFHGGEFHGGGGFHNFQGGGFRGGGEFHGRGNFHGGNGGFHAGGSFHGEGHGGGHR